MAFTDEPAGTIPEGGRFGADTYERARAFLRSGDAAPSMASSPAAPKAAPVVASRPKSTPIARPSTGAASAPTPRAAPTYTPKTISNEEMTSMARKEAIRPDTTVEETLLGGKAAKAAISGISKMLGRSAAPAGSTSREVATKYDKVTPIPNRPSMTRTEAISGPSGGRSAGLPGPGPAPSAPRVGSAPAASRVGTSPAAPRVGYDAPLTTASKPRVSSGRVMKPKSPLDTRKFNQDEAGVEFRNGGMVKATPKSTKYACGGPVKKA